MNLKDFQLGYLRRNHQFILIDNPFIISESCHSIDDVSSFYGKSLFELIPFLESFRPELVELKNNESKLYSCFSLLLLNRQSTFDFTFIKNDNTLVLVVEDRKDNYEELKKLQQGRNLSMIEGEIIEREAKLKSSFLANMSHEIRTPMNIVMGYTDLLISSQKLNEENQGFANNIQLAAKDLLLLIDDILDISKIEAGYLNIELVSFHLGELINNLKLVFNNQCVKRKLDFKFSVSERLPKIIKSDPLRINQILTNLISNAIKFTEEGGYVAVAVSVDEQEKTIVFEVSDSGIGIDEDKLDSIFESFSQAESNTTRRFGGTGLGLSIVKKLSELLEGSVSVESKKKVGTVFTVKVPLILGNEKALKKSEAAETTYDLKILDDKKLLIAEDNKMNQVLIAKVFENTNSKITIVGNGEEVLDLISKKKYDAILMDIQMPILDGFEAARQIVEGNSINSQTPIIAMTAHSFEEDIEKCRKAGMVGYISKPFNLDQLFAIIIEQIQKSNHKEKQKLVLNEANLDDGISNDATLDFKFLKEVSNGDHDFARAFLQTYIDEISQALLEMNTEVVLNNIKDYKSLLHKIKPSLEMIGLISLKDKIVKFEKGNYESNDAIQQMNSTLFPPIKQSLNTITKLLEHKELIL